MPDYYMLNVMKKYTSFVQKQIQVS